MVNDEDFNQAFASFARRENLPAAMSSEEWSTVPSDIRERAFFMSKVSDFEILQRFRDGVEDVIAGRKGADLVEKEIHAWLGDKGYQPPDGKAGGLEDLSSLARINVVIRTNVDMAKGNASWVSSQTAIRVFPCQELIRVSQREVPREWETIWAEARDKLKDIPGVHPTLMIALLNHPIWREISRFDQPYPPFDFGSGMGVRPIIRSDAKALGFDLDPNNDPMQQPLYRTMNDGLEVTPQVRDSDLRQSLSDRLGRFAEWDGDKLVHTDPDGSKKYPAEKMAEIWQRPAPAGFDRLEQKAALDSWDGGETPDDQKARIKLRQLFDRIETPEQPGELWRVTSLPTANAADFIRGLNSKTFQIPGDVAGWAWAKTAKEAQAMIPNSGGWILSILIQGVKRAIDVRALRPGKAGFVYVGGSKFKVIDFKQFAAAKRIEITLAESDD